MHGLPDELKFFDASGRFEMLFKRELFCPKALQKNERIHHGDKPSNLHFTVQHKHVPLNSSVSFTSNENTLLEKENPLVCVRCKLSTADLFFFLFKSPQEHVSVLGIL